MATLPAPKRVGKAQPTPNPPSEKAAPTSKGRTDVTTKIFVLDTCVLLFDHSALTNFEDNKVAIPITVLEELDRFKVGNETKHFEARECIRILDRLSQSHSLQDWIPLVACKHPVHFWQPSGNKKILHYHTMSAYIAHI